MRSSEARAASTLSQRFACWAVETSLLDTAATRQAAADQLMDALGCALAAYGQGQRVGLFETGRALGGQGDSAVIGLTQPDSRSVAALSNGMLCHALDFDSTHPGAVAHLSSVIGPAVLATAEAVGASGADALHAFVIGTEIAARVGRASSSSFIARGFHSTPICGVFGAAVAAGTLLGMSTESLANALGIAGSFASGLGLPLREGVETKAVHSGWAAQAAIVAAALAADGIVGPTEIFEGPAGLLDVYGKREDLASLDAASETLGAEWETQHVSFKAHPVCHFAHGAVDAAFVIAGGRGNVGLEDARIIARVPSAAVPFVLEPLAAKRCPRSPYDARFCLPYLLATVLAGRAPNGLLSAPHNDDVALRVAQQIDYEVVDFCTDAAGFPGGVSIERPGLAPLVVDVKHERGSEANPLSDGALLAKFQTNAELSLQDTHVDTLTEALTGMEEMADVRSIGLILGSARPGVVAMRT